MTELPENPTVADVLPTLGKPEEYLRRMLGNMIACKRVHGTAFVRIGVTGVGIAPHYRVSPSQEQYPGVDVPEGKQADVTPWFKAYNGRSHEMIEAWGLRQLGDGSWSQRETSLEEVRTLLGQVRVSKPKGF